MCCGLWLVGPFGTTLQNGGAGQKGMPRAVQKVAGCDAASRGQPLIVLSPPCPTLHLDSSAPTHHHLLTHYLITSSPTQQSCAKGEHPDACLFQNNYYFQGIYLLSSTLYYKLANFKTSNCSGQRSLSAATARPKDSVAGQGRRGARLLP